jgi:tetratricopeptide (TPR) repeat protein
VVGVAWLAASAFLAVERSLLWHDDTLFLHDIESQPRSVRLQFAASDYWIRRGDPQKQFFHIERAIELHPEPASTWLTLAWFFQRTHAVDGAMEAVNRGLHAASADSIYRFPLHWTRAAFLAARDEDDERGRQIALQQARRLLDSPVERETLDRTLAGHAEIERIWSEAAQAFAREGDADTARKASRAFDPTGTEPAR